jgi:hypothetical protein
MTAPKCNGCGVDLTSETDSEAHIFPNALGGRLAPKGLICRECNTLLDRLADNPLIKAFGPWPTLIDVPRHRGSNPPVDIETTGGQRIRVEANGTRTRSDLVYDVDPVVGGHKVEIGAYNWKVARQLIKKAAKQFPQLDPAKAEAHTRQVKIPPTDLWRIRTNFAPTNVFPAAFAAFWLFFLHRIGQTLTSWDRALEVIQDVKERCTFRYLPDGLPGLIGPDIPVSHKLVLRTVPATGELIGYCEVLGTVRVGGLLGKGQKGVELEYIYVADVFAKAERSAEFRIEPAKFEATNWKTVGIGSNDVNALKTSLEKAQAPLQAIWERREAELTAQENEEAGKTNQ